MSAWKEGKHPDIGSPGATGYLDIGGDTKPEKKEDAPSNIDWSEIARKSSELHRKKKDTEEH